MSDECCARTRLECENECDEYVKQLKQQLESVEKENRGLKMMLNHVAGVEHVCEDLEVKLAEAVELIEQFKKSLPYHEEEDIVEGSIVDRVNQFIAKYRGGEND